MTQTLCLDAVANPPVSANQPLVRCIDWAAFNFFFIALALPFDQIAAVPLGAYKVNCSEFVHLVTGALLCLKILLQAKIHHLALTVGTFLVVGAYFIGPLIIGSAERGDSITQISIYYFPFLLAVLWLMADTHFTVRDFFHRICWAAIFSAGSALAIQHLFPNYLQEHAGESIANAFVLAESGRLYWTNGPITFFVLLYFSVRDDSSRVGRLLALAALTVSLAAAFNTLSRTLLMGIVFFLIGSIFTAMGRREMIRRILLSLGITSFLAGVIAVLITLDERVRDLVYVRYFGSGGGAARIYEVDFVLGRVTLYKQYWERILGSHFLGQGFGIPFDIIFFRGSIVHFVTDVSILAFLLPMGIMGVAIFAAFLWRIWRLAGATTLPAKYTRNLRLLILISLGLSLNTELFCRSNFVVALTLLALALGNSAESRRQDPEAAHA